MIDRLLEPWKRAARLIAATGHVSIRQTVRGLVRSSGFSIVVITMMALGIGLNTAIFSLIDGILLRPFPYVDPDALVRIESRDQTSGNTSQASHPDLDDWRSRTTTFRELALFLPFQTEVRGAEQAESLRMAWITPELFPLLGVDAVIGRTLRAEEGRIGGDVHKAVISHALWQTMFDSAPDIIGRVLRLPQNVYTIVGVMPPGFRFPDTTDVWVSLASAWSLSPNLDLDQIRANRSFRAVGRLRPGVTLPQAQDELQRIGAQLEAEHPAVNRGIRPVLTPFRDAEVGRTRPYLILLLGGVSLLFVLCCVNVASLFLARCTDRVREMSIRIALGASRAFLIRQLLIESALLCACAGAAGVAVAVLAVRSFLAFIPIALPFWMRIDVDMRVLFYTALLTAATSVAFAVVPGVRVSAPALADSLRGARAASAGLRVERVRAALVVAEVAFSVALVALAAVSIRSVLNLQRVEPGFDPRGILTAQISPFRPGTVPQKVAGYAVLYHDVIGELAALPGVESAAGIDLVPFHVGVSGRKSVTVTGTAKGVSRTATMRTRLAGVSPGYFRTMRIHIDGRDFDDRDRAEGEAVVILSERAASQLFSNSREAIDQSICVDALSNCAVWYRVVGVAASVRYVADEAMDASEMYFPMTQRLVSGFDFVIRARESPSQANAIRQAVARADRNTAVVEVRPLSTLMNNALWQQRLSEILLTMFAGVSLAVAALGLYEVMAYLVRLRRREIGIRLALGATRAGVLGHVAGRGLTLTAAGLGIGLVFARLSSAWTRTVLFGVSPSDPASLTVVSAVFIAIALLACIVPVWRAAHIDPSVMLREE